MPDVMDVPYLLAIQLDSYREFLQAGASRISSATSACTRPSNRYSRSSATPAMLPRYVGYRLGEPAFDVKECVLRGVTFAVPLRVKVRLIIFDKESSNKAIKDIKEQEVYMGEIP